MNHDVTHCANYGPECPKDCHRAELTEDLKNIENLWPVSFAYFKYTDSCPKWPKKEETK